jgi:hypothetical protein
VFVGMLVTALNTCRGNIVLISSEIGIVSATE